jgi:hypothetical protein
LLQDCSRPLHCCWQHRLLLLLLLLWLLPLLTCQHTHLFNHALHQLLQTFGTVAAPAPAECLLHFNPAAHLVPFSWQGITSGPIHLQHMLQGQVTWLA